MNKNSAVFLSIVMVALFGCSKQAEVPQAASKAPTQVVNELPKPAPKKKEPLNEIDFSKYAGVTKPAAFGYYFGLTPEQIQQAGIDLEYQSSNGKFSVFQAASAPLAWDGAEDYACKDSPPYAATGMAGSAGRSRPLRAASMTVPR